MNTRSQLKTTVRSKLPALIVLFCVALPGSGRAFEAAPFPGSSVRFGRTAAPSAPEISQAQFFDEPLVPDRQPTLDETQALVAAMERFGRRDVRDDFSALTEFLERNPDSPWAPALETQLGSEYYRVGRYSKAISAWQHVWEAARSNAGEVSSMLANRGGSELAMMYARLGRMAELRPLLAKLEARPMRGSMPRNVRGARDGLWSMEHRPEVSFRCGPLALDRICFATDRAKAGNQLIQDSQSTTNGFSATQVAELSRRLGMNYQVAFRPPGAEVILPAVVHWKVGHYAALIARDRTLLRAEDPTFGNTKVWLSDDALDDEASGYFLVRTGPLPNGWRAVSIDEAGHVWGKGTTLKSDEDATTPDDEQTCKPSSAGMAQWNVHLLLASHHVEDTPVGYTPPVGPPIYVDVSYNSVNGWPAFGLPYSNVSQEWRLNWLAYLTDDPLNPAGDIRFATGAGGTMTFTDFNSTNQVFQNLFRNRANLVRTGTNSYELRYPDGSKKIFDQPDGSVGTARKIFMSAVVDAAGNAATIQFDQPGRIASITDAIGQRTQFFYERPLTNEFIHPSVAWVPPFLLTRVVDPFGRTARFEYGSSINARLASITDAIGITSSFLYDYKPGLPDLGMTNLITPYGTTVFKRGSYNGIYRANWVEITHPNGEKERVEYSEGPAKVFSSEPLSIVPKGLQVRNFILWARNTFHWDRKAYAEGYSLNDYTKARIYHWTHGLDYNTASPILESFKEPLEHRVWFNYEGQVNATFVGTSDRPTKIARTLEDGTAQLFQFQYNALGNATKAIDPLGRTFSFIYDTNQVDLIEVRQTRAGQNELLVTATYNSQHRPLTVTDAAGQTTRFSYNARGQMLSATNALGHTTTFTYATNGYLLAIDGPLPGTNDTRRFTYDTVGRLRTTTDQDNYSLTLDYDNMDRPTRLTYPEATYEEITYNRLDAEVLRDRAGRETRLTHDGLRQLVAAEDPLGRVTRFQWCGCGGLDAMIDPLGRATTWIRDLQGRVETKRNADGSHVQYTYDTATGWLKSVRDELNQVTKISRNLDGTIRQKTFLNANVATPTVEFTHDPNYPRLLTMEDGTGLTTFGYHPITIGPQLGAGRLASVDGPLSNDSITFTYDEMGRESGHAINGVGMRRTWDPAERLTQLTNALGTFGYTWDGASRRMATVSLPNGQNSTFTYHPNLKDKLLQQIAHLKPDASLLSRFTYDYNELSQITQWTQERSGANPIQWAFGYDGADQLTNAVAVQNAVAIETHAYSYDAAENLNADVASTGTRRFSHNALNELTSVAGSPLSAATNEWDAAHRLTAVVRGANRTEFSYDGFGRRVRIVEKTNGIVESDKRFVWCGARLCEERDGSGANTLKRFLTRGMQVQAGADLPAGSYFFTHDHLGSIREMSDATGAVRAQYSYDPYGQRTVISENAAAGFGFGGHHYHVPTGLHLALYRSYDAQLSRWLSRDPLPAANLYAFVRNDPVNYVDRFGLDESFALSSWESWKQTWDEAPAPVQFVKKMFEKHTEAGKVLKQTEDAIESEEKIFEALDDIREIKEAEEDPCLSKPEQGAVWLRKGLKYLGKIPGVDKVPFLGDYLQAVSNGATEALDAGQEHSTNLRDNGTHNVNEIRQMQEVEF